jgi:hypothetical protein
MKGNRAVIATVVAIVLVVGGWWLFNRGSAGEPIDLLARYDEATKQPDPGTFTLRDVDLAGQTRRAIAVNQVPASRLRWTVRVPDDAWISVAVGLLPEAWEQEGDGVLFRVGVSDGRTFEDLATQNVNPFVNKGDRRWIPVMIDLSMYAGEEVELNFNTNGSLPGRETDVRNDLAVWGSPEIVVR